MDIYLRVCILFAHHSRILIDTNIVRHPWNKNRQVRQVEQEGRMAVGQEGYIARSDRHGLFRLHSRATARSDGREISWLDSCRTARLESESGQPWNSQIIKPTDSEIGHSWYSEMVKLSDSEVGSRDPRAVGQWDWTVVGQWDRMAWASEIIQQFDSRETAGSNSSEIMRW